MRHRGLVAVGLAAGLFVMAGGCAIGYNGAWMPVQDQRLAQAAKRTAPAARARSSGGPAKAAVTRASSNREAPPPREHEQPVVASAGASVSSQPPATEPARPRSSAAAEVMLVSHPAAGAVTPTDGVGALGVYGGLSRGESSATSPLDGLENLRQITLAIEGSDFDPAVDPTGTWLVYSSTQHRPTADLYLKRVDGSAVTQLTSDPGNDVMPAISPDGKWVAFASDRAGNWDIYLMSIDGGKPIQLTSDPTDELHPSFSPDSQQLVFCSFGSQSGQWELVVIDIDKPATRKFIGFGLFPEWSRTGDRIVFQRGRERGARWFSIWTVDLVNGEATPPTEVVSGTGAAVITPSWSPDSSQIAFSAVTEAQADPDGAPGRPTEAALWVVNADGTGRKKLTQSHFADLQPAWAPDGTIYFVSNRAKDQRESIWAVRAGPPIKVVESQPMHEAEPASPTAKVEPPPSPQPPLPPLAQPQPPQPAADSSQETANVEGLTDATEAAETP